MIMDMQIALDRYNQTVLFEVDIRSHHSVQDIFLTILTGGYGS